MKILYLLTLCVCLTACGTQTANKKVNPEYPRSYPKPDSSTHSTHTKKSN